MIRLKSAHEIETMKKGGAVLARIIQEVAHEAVPGVATRDLEKRAAHLLEHFGVKPAFKGFQGYPFITCLSVNEEVVHTPPQERVLSEGDIVGIDIGIWYQGLCVDAAVTVGVGTIDAQRKRLLKVTRTALEKGIRAAVPFGRVGDISHAVQSYVEAEGFSVVRDLVGHGVGYEVHEDPRVPNFGVPGTGEKLVPGMVIAIEPMVTCGGYKIKTLADGWTIVTADGSLAAQFEHTVAVTEKGPDILTTIS